MSSVVIEYFDERKGFWRVGYLEKANRTWAWVRPVIGRKVRVPVTQTREIHQTELRIEPFLDAGHQRPFQTGKRAGRSKRFAKE